MNLFIGNLNPQTTEDSLRELFSEFGEIVSIKVPVDSETGMPRGFGFVEMADRFESFDAIDNIDGTYFEGQVITVKESKPKNQQGRSGGGRGGNRGGYNRGGGGGGYRSNDRGGSSFGRSGGSGYRSNDRGGYGERSYGSDRDRSYGNDRGYGRSYDSDRSEKREQSDDPNKQPGRRFSPRGPRPDRDN